MLLMVANLLAFYYMRPSVCILTDDVPYTYFSKVDGPKKLTMDYRTTWRTTENLERLSRYDMVIDMTVDGVESLDNVYRMEYDLDSLFMPIVENLNDRNVYILYDESSESETSFALEAEGKNPSVELISYDREIERSTYALLESRMVEGSYVVALNLQGCMGFLRYAEKDFTLVADYLDSAALEDGADIVAVPDWDGMIRGFLSI